MEIITDCPGFIHAATFEGIEPAVVHAYVSTAVDLDRDALAAPLRNYLAGHCHAVCEYGEHVEPMFWDGRGRSMTLRMLDQCPGQDVPHVCSVLQSGTGTP